MSTEFPLQSNGMTISRERNNSVLSIQHDIMQQLASGNEHHSILNSLCKIAEEMAENTIASIMVFEENQGFMKVIAAPSIPPSAIEQLNGLVPGPHAGSYGASVFFNESQYVFDTRTDNRWHDLKKFARDFNIGASWSSPIRINDQAPIGSFALSSADSRRPCEFIKRLIETSAYVAGIVIKRQQEQAQLWKLAHYDPLTNLPNRNFFHFHLEHTVQTAHRKQQKMALLFLDIDNFKDINDTQGHIEGDQVIKYIAFCIQSSLRKGDIIARIGGDEFVVLIEDLENPHLINSICAKISRSFKPAITINQIDYPLSISIGISIFPDHGDTAQMLLRNADTAMYEAKKAGFGRFLLYQDRLTRSVTDRLQMTADIKLALEQHDFIVFYQPQYSCTYPVIQGVEALVRWQHPAKGLLYPGQFIPVAEQSGLINELGMYVLLTACQQCQVWWKMGLPKFSLAVNLSAKQLRPGFAQKLQAVLQDIDFPASQLELEVTESFIMKFGDLNELNTLKELGITISMDDFGTGHSSLAQLKRLPISKLKIDRSFVEELPGNSNDKVIAATIINMGHSMGLEVIAEGVETDAQKAFLAEHQCDLLQGYLLGKPVPAKQFERWIMDQSIVA